MDYTDSEFLAAVENCSIEAFHHKDHIRLALLYATAYEPSEATARMIASIRRLSAHAGKPEKYHHTMTIAWMRLAAHLLDKTALTHHYSPALINSDLARTAWIEPDLAPLPTPPREIIACE